MKTFGAFSGLTALVLAALILGMTPAAAQVDAFVSRLNNDNFEVQEGRFALFDYVQRCCAAGTPITICSFFNQTSPYFVGYLPISPGQLTAELPFTRDPLDYSRSAVWRLRPDEAVVLVGLTPPAVRYLGIQTYRFSTVDEKLGRVRRWNNFGDQTNQFTIKTAGTPNATRGDPFNSRTIYILTADAGIDARVREAARRAGYAPPIMNTEPIPQAVVRMGLDEDADQFNFVFRAAIPYDAKALADYQAQDPPTMRVFRVTPKTEAPAYPDPSADPFPVPSFRAHGTGQTEFALLPAVRDLRKAILTKYGDLDRREFVSEQFLFYGFHHLDVNDDGIAPSTDALYLWLKESFGTLDEDEFVIVYGVNHQQTGKAMYMSASMYGLTKQVSALAIDDRKLAGSAADYLQNNPDADKLYAYKFARHCDEGDQFCFAVPYGCCAAHEQPCVGEPGCAGMKATEEGTIVWRAYLDPTSKTGPDPAEVILDKAIKFSPKR